MKNERRNGGAPKVILSFIKKGEVILVDDIVKGSGVNRSALSKYLYSLRSMGAIETFENYIYCITDAPEKIDHKASISDEYRKIVIERRMEFGKQHDVLFSQMFLMEQLEVLNRKGIKRYDPVELSKLIGKSVISCRRSLSKLHGYGFFKKTVDDVYTLIHDLPYHLGYHHIIKHIKDFGLEREPFDDTPRRFPKVKQKRKPRSSYNRKPKPEKEEVKKKEIVDPSYYKIGGKIVKKWVIDYFKTFESVENDEEKETLLAALVSATCI